MKMAENLFFFQVEFSVKLKNTVNVKVAQLPVSM